MWKYIIGTTPTIVYTFSTLAPTDFTEAVLTFKRNGEIILEKDLDGATVGENYLSWTLTQSDTLALGVGTCKVMINYLYENGEKRAASAETSLMGKTNHISEVMTDE